VAGQRTAATDGACRRQGRSLEIRRRERAPALAAKTAAQLDQAADGRFILGLGVGNAVMNARFGIPPQPPLAMSEEYVGVIRAVLGGQASALHPDRSG
jgi:alkanesulfonate monooxygenase SsuD/methylene tetrahydromethanopterin reductase-like flavin-dependent oxidoreductase (luciferase family)